MDPPSLDTAIQHALAGLYPPFEATAPTVLAQVFRLLDSDFGGDGLSFLLDFLIPAKRLCEQVREAACAPYAHRLFLHQGWPLCLREGVVLHLAPLSALWLRPGDFYLQVEPQEEQSACITIKCLSSDLRSVDKKPVPVSSYPVLFTQEWLEAINSGLEGSPLQNCLVASESGIAPVSWAKIASPEFVDDGPCALSVLSPARGALRLSSPQELHRVGSPSSQVLLAQGLAKGKGRTHENKYPGLIKVEQARPGEAAFRMDSVVSRDLEGDYVALLGFPQASRGESPGREVEPHSAGALGALAELPGAQETPPSQRLLPLSGDSGEPALEQASAKPESFQEEPCSGGLKRKVGHDAPASDLEQQPREPDLGRVSDLSAGVLEDPAISQTQGLLGKPETRVQLGPRPRQASSPCPSPASPVAPAAATKAEETKEGSRRPPRPVTCPGGNPSPSASPAPGLQSSFSEGQRLSPTPPAGASLQQDKPQKVSCPLHSPRPCRAEAPGEDGTAQTKTSGPAADSGLWAGEQTGFPEASAGPPQRGPTALQEEPPGPAPGIGALSVEILHSRIACLPGGRDRAGRPLLLVSTTEGAWEEPWCTASELTQLLSYLCTVPRPEEKAKGLAVVLDARKQPPQPGLLSALQATQALAPASIRSVLFLGEKRGALALQTACDVQVEVLTSLKALGHHVEPSQLPAALEGPFPYCHSEWVQFFQRLDPFLATLRQASSLLQASIEEFKKGAPPAGVQEATRCLSKFKDLMEAVLRDPGLLDLQRDGGATLARLRREASRLDFNPDIRSHLAEAATLYGLVDEQLHVLVTASNHLLGRLELRVSLGRLEAAIRQVSDWMEREGSRCLQALAPEDGSLEAVEKAHMEFEDFFLQAAAQYRRGLELSKQAAQLGAAAGGPGEAGGAEAPELAAFASTQRAFQAKLTHFYMAAERQRTDLETLLHLHRFCRKLAWFHMDCRDLMSQLRLGKAQRASPGDQRRLQRYLQRLASEFSAQKLTAMGLQVASLSRVGMGQDLWEEARARHEETQALLQKALAHCPSTAVPATHRGVAAKDHGPNGDVTSKERRDLPLQDSPAGDPSPKSHWPRRGTRGRPGRNCEAGQAGPPDLTPERFLAALFSRQRLPRHSRAPRAPGGSFSSEGTDSQTSLEDSPQTSPPASL
uniref:KIAA1755 n=1 Tax=Oryctolagus cuniculus TaxID=9986 RepID=G1TQ95_RABIT